MDENDYYVRNKLEKVLKEKGITKREFAKMIGMQRTYLQKNDMQNNYSLNNIAAMMIALDCKFEDLFEIVKF